MKRSIFLLVVAFCISFTSTAQSAIGLYQEGITLKDEKKISEAANKFKKAIQLKPGYADALYELGWCYNDMKDYTGAISALRQTMPAMKTFYKANFELGYAFEMTAKYDSATYYYNKCLSINPDNSGVHKRAGYVEYQLENYAKALEHFVNFEKTVKTEIADYLYWYRKGFMQNALKDFSSAKISLNKSLEFKTDYMNTYLELGFACSRLKENNDAINWYKKAIEIDPKSHIGYNGIGEVYRDNIKNRDMSMSWYQKTLDINPNERKANFGMGYCLNSKERYSEAVPYLKKAIEMEDTYTAAYVELGYSYYKTGNHTDAIYNLKKAIELSPKNENGRYYLGLVYISQKDKANAQRMVTELKSLNSANAASLESLVNKM
ncbi:MAG: tetratricopeptide repeat protein [Chitinophagaceae bacterium]|nr:tetratricopeptide repeat protein [Chitinophagaceae bacterium]